MQLHSTVSISLRVIVITVAINHFNKLGELPQLYIGSISNGN